MTQLFAHVGRQAIFSKDLKVVGYELLYRDSLENRANFTNGDEATAESYFSRLNDSPDGPVVRSFGRYLDVLVRCDDGAWRIRERRLERESLITGAPVT